MAQLAYNDKRSDITRLSPFFVNYGRHANLFLDPRQGPNAEKALVLTSDMKSLHKDMQHKINKTNAATEKSVNKRRKLGPQLKKGDKAYLLTKNLKSIRPSRKLDHIKVGPFLVIRNKGPVNYELQLPPDAKIHPVFHISMLEPADPNTPLQETFYYYIEEENEFEAEKILSQRGQSYLVKWKGYEESESTWEPVNNLENCRNLLQQFRQHQQTQTSRSQEGLQLAPRTHQRGSHRG